MFTRQAGGVARLPQVERQLRSRSACGRPAEAARLLPDPGLCRFPRRFRACRADAGPPRLRHHLRRRGRSPLQVRHGRGRERSSRSAAREDQGSGQSSAGRLVQRQGGRGRRHAAERGSRQPRLRLRRHQSRLRPQCREAGDEHHASASARRLAIYVERIDIQGNTSTRDKVIRREFRINEGDAFNALKVKRSQDRLQSLGFFQENLEIKQTEGSTPDRVVLGVNVEEKSTGELQLSAGYSSLEKFILAFSIAQRNFMGKGQELNAGVNWSRYSKVGPARLRRALFVRQADPARRRHLPPGLQQLQLCRQRAQHDLFADQHGHGAPPRVPDHRICDARHALLADQRQDHARREHLLHRSGPCRSGRHGPLPPSNGPLPPECDPRQGRSVSLRRTRHAPDVVDRIFGRLQRYERHPANARPVDRPLAGLRRPWRRRAIHS